jgi:hypothetical protein
MWQANIFYLNQAQTEAGPLINLLRIISFSFNQIIVNFINKL